MILIDKIINRVGSIVYVDYWVYRHFYFVVDYGVTIQNSKKDEVVSSISLEEFADGREIIVVGRIALHLLSSAIETAKSRIGEKYNLFFNNRERSVNETAGDGKKSFQVRKYTAGTTDLALSTMAYSKNPVVAMGDAGVSAGAMLTKNEKDVVKNMAIGSLIGAGIGFFASRI